MMRVLMVSVCLAAGMAAAAVPGLPKQWLDKAAAMQWLAAHPDGARFVSWGGVRQGGDSDATVELTPPNKAEVTEFGAAIVTYTGTYDINEAGEITLNLDKAQVKWPVMYLYATPRDAWLMRTDMKTGFSLGGDSGFNSGGTPFWPFKWKRRA